VALALRARGFATARPVAVGRRDGSSCYLCAELTGRSLRALLASGGLAAATARAAARFAGDLLKSGVVLPDLSADHVYVLDAHGEDDGGSPAFAVLDLHNGRLGEPTTRDLRRILRHLRRSVRGLPVSRRLALEFALVLLRRAGRRDAARALLSAQPPWTTHDRYDAPGKSGAYRTRDRGRHQRELACLQRVWPADPGRVLDVPCGTGRLTPFLREHGAAGVVGADRSRAMLHEGGDGTPRVQADALALPFADGVFDTTVSFRFLHHLDPATARRFLGELARVTRRHLVVSFFHPVSTHGARRSLAHLLRNEPRTRHTLSPGRLTRWLGEEDFEPLSWAAESPYLREFWVACFKRR
jgi:SAM-dependent methyltransferase